MIDSLIADVITPGGPEPYRTVPLFLSVTGQSRRRPPPDCRPAGDWA